MDQALLMAILIMCSAVCVSFKVPPGVDVRCPSTYRVQATGDKVIDFNVVDNKSECIRLSKGRQTKGIQTNDVEPYITTVYKDGQYRANISWDFSLRGKRLPKIFLINLTFYENSEHYKYLNDTCVILRLIGNRKIKTKTAEQYKSGNGYSVDAFQGSAQFYFDCLPLLTEPDIGLVVQVWSYSRHGRPCRSLRSVPEKKSSCDPDVKCSKKYSFPISKNAHSYIQCKCYTRNHGEPKLNWNYDYKDEIFYIRFTNVPPYLSYAEIDIVDALDETKLDDFKVYNTHNGEIQANSTKFAPGEYTLYAYVYLKLYLKCTEPKSHSERQVDDLCGDRQHYTFKNQQIIVSLDKTEKDKVQHQTILGIAVGVTVSAIFITVTFVNLFCRKRKMHGGSNSGLSRDIIEMRELRPEQEPLRDEYQIARDTEMESSPRDAEMEKYPLELQALSAEREINRGNSNKYNLPNQTQRFKHEMLQSSSVPSESESYQRSENIHSKTISEKNTYQVMLLHHSDADNPEHIQRVAEFTKTLSDKYGIIIERMTDRNWYEFAESAFDKFLNVVLIISNELYRICHHYINSGQNPGELLLERNKEMVPCIILNKMQTLIRNSSEGQCCSKRTHLILHVVNLGDNDHILQLFLNDHPFLKSEHSKLYHFRGTDLYLEDLTCLLDNFKPKFDTGMPSDLQMMLMHMNKDSESLEDMA